VYTAEHVKHSRKGKYGGPSPRCLHLISDFVFMAHRGTSCASQAAVLVAAGFAGLGSPLAGQSADRPRAPADGAAVDGISAITTLSPWANEVWLALLDRDGASDGRLSRDGIFQRFSLLMDSEYDLDVRSGLVEHSNDIDWERQRSGVRVRGASITPARILNRVEWKQETQIADGVDLLLRYRREHSLTAKRDYPWVGLAWRDLAGSGWTLSTGLGIHSFKPSADVEVGVSRRWTTEDGGGWALDLGVAALDAFNDVIFESIGVDPLDADAYFDYRSAPLATRASLLRTSRRWLVELQAGSSKDAAVDVAFPSPGEGPFAQHERVWYVGALGQVAVRDGLDAALYGTVARADTERIYPGPGELGYALREESRRIGTHVRAGLGGPWRLEAHAERLWRPEERTRSGGPHLSHEDREDYYEFALVMRPAVGVTARLAYHDLDRIAGPRAGWLTDAHRRLTTEGGYRFASGFRVTAGIRWDLDGSQPARFDGAHLRMMAFW